MMYGSGLFDIFCDHNATESIQEFRDKVRSMGAYVYHQKGKKGIRVHNNGSVIPREVIDFIHDWADSRMIEHAYGAFSPADISDPGPGSHEIED